ncbi:putative SNF7 protein [Cyclospora cayetanensis]|uniref:SNF7 protein n=1 Tax=Cyclospora cayetanensis TaxID=88456 RepID=A0A1D3D4R5_9EIME|nr:putative SNF7 protein [Cyclospora cayetanensis]
MPSKAAERPSALWINATRTSSGGRSLPAKRQVIAEQCSFRIQRVVYGVRSQAQSEAARACVACSDRNGAMLALQRRRLLLRDLQQLAAARLTLERQLLQLEATQAQKVAVSAMAAAAYAHKELSKQLNSNTVERLLDELTEQQEAQQELVDALHQNATPAEEEASPIEMQKKIEDFCLERGESRLPQYDNSSSSRHNKP